VNLENGRRGKPWSLALPILLLGTLSFHVHAFAQNNRSASGCPSPEIVLQQYAAALGGQAALDQVQTRVLEAHETEPHTFNPQVTAHDRYQFRWKSPNRVVAKQKQFPFGWTTFIYTGTAWSNFDGRVSHNEDNTPAWRKDLSLSVYNDNPQFLMFRVVADPTMLATNRNLYRGFESLPGTPDQCVLLAIGKSEWGRERRDILSFDAKTNLLKTWAIQMGMPGSERHSEFRFDDYRQAGPVKIPFSIYFDFYQATFHFTKVLSNAPLSDSEFVPKP
jgi:hypothetical protein